MTTRNLKELREQTAQQLTLGERIDFLLEAEDGRTIEEMIAADEFDEVVIEEAKRGKDGRTTVSWDNGITTSLKGPEIKVGDAVRLYGGAMLGDEHYGWALNGKVIEWETPLERALKRLEWLVGYDRRQREEFAEKKAQLDADYEGLPPSLKQRIDRFRSEDPSFRVKSEGYEMFCCVEAAKFAEAARAAVAAGETEDAEKFWADEKLRAKAGGKVWEERPESAEGRWLLWAWALNSKAYDYDYERARALLGESNEHSGNTFGGAMHLAYGLLAEKEL